ncbi:TetR family transcriptional regulator [Lentibacillus salinarum]|uniref:TetR family transcriptional regulator n=1 Tax=Lentibacillus salinarum TaxID=446820 RepID=A0ABW3ZWX9_9BACI
MPKQTFFNLPEKKRQTLMRAVEMEFSRVPMYEASIANIVKAADIPRGSFYQYFADKEDAFFFLLDKLSSERKDLFVSLLKQHDGDLVESIAAFFQTVITEGENLDFMKNAFLNMTHEIEDSIARIFSDRKDNQEFREVSALIDKQKLNITDETELFHVIQILTSVMVHNFVETFARNLSDKEAMDHLSIELNLLKAGVYKHE